MTSTTNNTLLDRIIKNLPPYGNMYQVSVTRPKISIHLTKLGLQHVLNKMKTINEVLYYNKRNTRLTETEYSLMTYESEIPYNYVLPLQGQGDNMPLYLVRTRQNSYFITNCILQENESEYKNYMSDLYSLIESYRGHSSDGTWPIADPQAEITLMNILVRMCEVFIKYEINSSTYFRNFSPIEDALNNAMRQLIASNPGAYDAFVDSVLSNNLNPYHIFWRLDKEEDEYKWIKGVDIDT